MSTGTVFIDRFDFSLDLVGKKRIYGAVEDAFGGDRLAQIHKVYGAPPAPGTPLLHDRREAGKTATAAYSIALGAPIGLAILHRRARHPAGDRGRREGGGAGAAFYWMNRLDWPKGRL